MGGATAERQVSLMSGTNIWLKTRTFPDIDPHPYIMQSPDEIWRVPYPLLLNHTVEEIIDVCKSAINNEMRIASLVTSTRLRLSIPPHIELVPYFSPYKTTLDEIKNTYTTLFLALHGGI